MSERRRFHGLMSQRGGKDGEQEKKKRGRKVTSGPSSFPTPRYLRRQPFSSASQEQTSIPPPRDGIFPPLSSPDTLVSPLFFFHPLTALTPGVPWHSTIIATQGLDEFNLISTTPEQTCARRALLVQTRQETDDNHEFCQSFGARTRPAPQECTNSLLGVTIQRNDVAACLNSSSKSCFMRTRTAKFEHSFGCRCLDQKTDCIWETNLQLLRRRTCQGFDLRVTTCKVWLSPKKMFSSGGHRARFRCGAFATVGRR